MAGRAPVATLLKQLLDQTHYRALLQTTEGGSRAQRNVDKLLADAHTSGQVSVREFAEYVRTLRDAAPRSALRSAIGGYVEARILPTPEPARAGGSGFAMRRRPAVA